MASPGGGSSFSDSSFLPTIKISNYRNTMQVSICISNKYPSVFEALILNQFSWYR